MKKRIMIVKKEKCNPEGCGGYLCMRVSPSNRAGKEAILKDTDGKVKVNEEVITDADRIAANKCPFGALTMVNLPDELNQDPIHRYPPNGFALYKLPIPIFGKVVGIIGRNGIGKSTTLNILAGILKPNLGEDGKKATYKDLIERFKGTEAQTFFEKLEKKEIKIAYKPQMVDQIPKAFTGTVNELLKKSDEKNELDKIIEELQLKNILNHDIKDISGGELQRVAIAATVLKKANLYMFDEPTSYLDIKQRIKISKFIKKLANENTAVLVIEHDLIILDYMTDLIHLMYGQEGAYGICSLAKTTKAGINTYLSGYITDENMRFRDHEIKFDKHAQEKEHKSEQLTKWEQFKYKIGQFSLDVEQGNIERHDIIGILGENGIGKTTFAKIISGQIKEEDHITQKETNHGKLKISYKPQYIEKNDELVIIYLKEAMKYDLQLIRPLQIKQLMNKTLNQLSGGELQRVAIAKCLSEEADIYLMDEPSAYLDVEQRLTISKAIKEMMIEKGKSAIIIDHDLLFIDYLSNKILVFEGEPAIKGKTSGPHPMENGMNRFLKELNITFRRDEESHRPRVNKIGSQKDQEQKSSGKLYYS
ncbi:ribosome biogenesis/translation initiation ATPase RLI [Candidatus Woesearchaeota archaeon]|nr:ribosome biogenesis/translation initiation ATPase RLI [Candidatus Woesearchaeota archaeon]